MQDISSKYVILDIKSDGSINETNGLLSITIYKPDDKSTYEKHFPLALQDETKSTTADLIVANNLTNDAPLTQKEFDDIVDKFELEARTILVDDNFSREVLKNYLDKKI